MEKSVILYENKTLNVSVRVIENPDGSVSMNAEDAAFGFGWTQNKDGKTYPRWDTVNQHCRSFGFSQQVGKDTYIPEAVFYLLGMKANNKTAQDFQKWIALDVLPSIRRTGSYAVKNAAEQRRMTNAQARLTAANAKQMDAEARLLREQNRTRKLDADFLSELRRAKPADRPIVLEVLRRNGINVPEETASAKRATHDDEETCRAALETLLNAGETIGERRTYKRAEYLCILNSTFRDALENAGYDAETVLRWMNKNERIRTANNGKSTVNVRIGERTARAVWIKLPTLV